MTNGVREDTDEKGLNVEAIRRSAIEHPSPSVSPPASYADTILWSVGSSSDEFEPWGSRSRVRDRQLRAFTTSESNFASALGIICSRNAAFSFNLEGPERVVRKYAKIFEEAEFGAGWDQMIIKVSIDIYTQDNAGYIQIVRDGENFDSEVIGLNHLDSARCYPTGAPETPVIYRNAKGELKLLKWYQVIPLADMPMPVEHLPGLQLCALSRLLIAAEIMRNVAIFDYEKTGGRHTRAIHLIRGISANAIRDAIRVQGASLDARGLRRYSDPLIVSGIDPTADVGHDTLEFASLPDNLDRESAMKWYVAQMAMAFFEDYQTFAPLPGGGLGTSAQSQTLHDKARGKGPGLFRKMITHAINFRVLPDNVEFKYEEQDLDQELQEAEAKAARANERAVRITSGEITVEVARVMAKDSGDLDEELFEMLGATDVTPDVTVTDDSSPDSQLGDANAPRVPAQPAPTAPPAPAGQQPQRPPQGPQQAAQRRADFGLGQRAQDDRAGPTARDEVEEDIADVFDRAFSKLLPRVEKLIQEMSVESDL